MKNRTFIRLAIAVAFVALMPLTHAQTIYVTNSNSYSQSVGAYDGTTGIAINTAFISGITLPTGIAVSGPNLFIASGTGIVGEYDITTGAVINASVLSGLNDPDGIAISGSTLFAANSGGVGSYNLNTGAGIRGIPTGTTPSEMTLANGKLYVAILGSKTVGVFNPVTGAAINAPLVTGLNSPEGIAVSGSNLYVSNFSSGTIGLYNATTGAVINASFISGLNKPAGLALDGSNLYVVNQGADTIGEYDASTGATINASLVSGLILPLGIVVVSAIPEPSTYALIFGSLALAGVIYRRRKSGRTASILMQAVVVLCLLTFASSTSHANALTYNFTGTGTGGTIASGYVTFDDTIIPASSGTASASAGAGILSFSLDLTNIPGTAGTTATYSLSDMGSFSITRNASGNLTYFEFGTGSPGTLSQSYGIVAAPGGGSFTDKIYLPPSASNVVDVITLSGSLAAIPEPSTYGLIFGAVSLAGVAYRRRTK